MKYEMPIDKSTLSMRGQHNMVWNALMNCAHKRLQLVKDKQNPAYRFDESGHCFRWQTETLRKIFYPQCIVLPTVEEAKTMCEEGVSTCAHNHLMAQLWAVG